MSSHEKQEQLQIVLEQLAKKYGKGVVMKLNSQQVIDIPTISTGSLSLDLALGVGGLPCGRIAELYGPPSSGKTTLALHAMAEAQRKGGVAALIDSEHAFDKSYAQALGVDVDSLLIAQPDDGEQALEIADQLIRSSAVDLVVVDSVAALVPKSELEGEMGDQRVGAQARLMSQALRKLTGTIYKTGAVCLFINQLREKIGVLFGNPETTPGGHALKFYSSVRLNIRKTAQLKQGADEMLGHRVKVEVTKNKVAPPFRTAAFDIIYGQGISRSGEIIDLGLALQLIKQAGSWYTWQNHKLGQGREGARSWLKEHPESQQQLTAEIKQAMAQPTSN